MGPWWLTWHTCLYICENCEMSRLWHTNTRTNTRTVESRAVFSLNWIRKMISMIMIVIVIIIMITVITMIMIRCGSWRGLWTDYFCTMEANHLAAETSSHSTWSVSSTISQLFQFSINYSIITVIKTWSVSSKMYSLSSKSVFHQYINHYWNQDSWQ